MEKTLNILVIEDLEDDLLLLIRHLKKNGYSVNYYRVVNEQELNTALQRGGWDLVISDYSLPHFTGLLALKAFKKFNLDIPFILLSGTIGEDVAVEAMKSGASDYIMKDKLTRLIPAIERGLSEAKNRREKYDAQKQLRESEESYRTLVENAVDIIATISPNGEVLTINDAVKTIGDWEKDEIIWKPFNNLIHPDDLEKVYSRMQKTFEGIQQDEYELRLQKKNGSYIIGSVKTTRLLKYGKIFGILVFIRDVTARKEMEEKIAVFSKASNQSPVSIIITDLNGEVSFVNNHFQISTGFSKDDIKLLKAKDLIAPELTQEEYETIWKEVKLNEIWRGEYYSKTKLGISLWESVSITPIKDDDSNIIRYLIIKIDMTQRKEMLSDLLKAKRVAEAANKIKSEFLAQMSHEIRTPLNTMLSSLQLFKTMLGDSLDEDEISCLKGAESASQRIIRTIDLILNMTEVQVGSYEPEMKEINIYSEILEKLILEKYTECKNKGLEITLSKQTDLTEAIVDEYSVFQIFDNIISNAIKYTSEGSVKINCSELNGNLSVSVIDTGIGISRDNLSSIFRAFSQEDHGYTRRYDGNGLGLTLVHEYCKLNNAIIEVESEKGFGSTFTVTFYRQY